MSGWASGVGRSTRRRPLSHRIGALLLLPLLVSLIGLPAAPPVQGDELSAARARQARLRKDVANQRAQVARLQRLQGGLADDIQDTAAQVRGINADLGAVKTGIARLNVQIETVETDYQALVLQLGALDQQLIGLERQEADKRADLAERKDLLADRVRDAYDTDRTSLLETFLSIDTFTDLLAEVSYQVDVGEQDRALASEIADAQEALAELHQTVADTRTQTNELRQLTAAQKRSLDRSRASLRAAEARLAALETEARAELARQKAAFAKLNRNEDAARKALAKAHAAQARLQARIADLVRRRAAQYRIPSSYNGALRWPMHGTVSQNFGCTGFGWEPRVGRCRHFHRGIDVVAAYGTPVRASGAGTIVYIGWNYADGADPAWIVVIAHSSALQTWYAHMLPKRPNGIRAGSRVRAGQIIGYEGNTGHSTGAHLHWAVMYRGSFMNPRLFL